MDIEVLEKPHVHPDIEWDILYSVEGTYEPETEKIVVGIHPNETIWWFSPTPEAIVHNYNAVIIHELVEWGYDDPEYHHTDDVCHLWDMTIGRILYELSDRWIEE